MSKSFWHALERQAFWGPVAGSIGLAGLAVVVYPTNHHLWGFILFGAAIVLAFFGIVAFLNAFYEEASAAARISAPDAPAQSEPTFIRLHEGADRARLENISVSNRAMTAIDNRGAVDMQATNVRQSGQLQFPTLADTNLHMTSTIFQIDFSGLWAKTDAYIDVIVYASSMFNELVTLTEVEGRMAIDGQECSLPPRLVNGPRELRERGGRYDCRIRQPLTREMARELVMSGSGMNLRSDEVRVHISLGSMRWVGTVEADNGTIRLPARAVSEESLIVRGPVREEDSDKIVWRVEPVFVSQVWYQLSDGSRRPVEETPKIAAQEPRKITLDERRLITFCNQWAGPTIENALMVLGHLTDAMRSTGGGLPFYSGNLLNDHFQAIVGNSLGAFKEACNVRDFASLQRAAAQSYRAYSEMIFPMRDFGEATEFDFIADGNYRKWKDLDAHYLLEFNGMVNDPLFEVLNKEMLGAIHQGGTRHYWA